MPAVSELPTGDFPESGFPISENTQLQKKDSTNKERNILLGISEPLTFNDKPYFLIAKSFHKLLMETKAENKSIKEAKYQEWVNTVRLAVEKDGRSIDRLVCIRLYFEACRNEEKGTDTFWLETVGSLAFLRKKNKDGVYQIENLLTKVSKWYKLEGNEKRVHEELNNFKALLNDNNGN